ncbi:MAG: hypothetical protein QXE46_00480 [Candidatus Thermoplasmatota archaeon]
MKNIKTEISKFGYKREVREGNGAIYQAFIVMLSIFLSFILTTITVVSLSQSLEFWLKILLLAILILAFEIFAIVMVRTHAKQLEKSETECPPYNDEMMSVGVTLINIGIGAIAIFTFPWSKWSILIIGCWIIWCGSVGLWSVYKIKKAKEKTVELKN